MPHGQRGDARPLRDGGGAGGGLGLDRRRGARHPLGSLTWVGGGGESGVLIRAGAVGWEEGRGWTGGRVAWVARREVPHAPPGHRERLAEAVHGDCALPHPCGADPSETSGPPPAHCCASSWGGRGAPFARPRAWERGERVVLGRRVDYVLVNLVAQHQEPRVGAGDVGDGLEGLERVHGARGVGGGAEDEHAGARGHRLRQGLLRGGVGAGRAAAGGQPSAVKAAARTVGCAGAEERAGRHDARALERRNPSLVEVGTITGSAPERRTISG